MSGEQIEALLKWHDCAIVKMCKSLRENTDETKTHGMLLILADMLEDAQCPERTWIQIARGEIIPHNGLIDCILYHAERLDLLLV